MKDPVFLQRVIMFVIALGAFVAGALLWTKSQEAGAGCFSLGTLLLGILKLGPGQAVSPAPAQETKGNTLLGDK